ncbi:MULTISPECIES: hypothetical protein [Proteus]|uniref:hypothetical protein n=2 Tax=Morganellaceae TaxID=1903414 RepID=UPI001F18DB84|nr:hypothetical protein [Proteus terrae]MCE9840399.1 hypothetical protein [Proteus terrae]
MCVIDNIQNKSERGSILLNTMFILLFFNISFVAIIGYSQSLKADFQRLIQIQQAGQELFVLFEQMSEISPDYFASNRKIMTRSLLQSEGCQQIEGYVANHVLPTLKLYYWSCY